MHYRFKLFFSLSLFFISISVQAFMHQGREWVWRCDMKCYQKSSKKLCSLENETLLAGEGANPLKAEKSKLTITKGKDFHLTDVNRNMASYISFNALDKNAYYGVKQLCKNRCKGEVTDFGSYLKCEPYLAFGAKQLHHSDSEKCFGTWYKNGVGHKSVTVCGPAEGQGLKDQYCHFDEMCKPGFSCKCNNAQKDGTSQKNNAFGKVWCDDWENGNTGTCQPELTSKGLGAKCFKDSDCNSGRCVDIWYNQPGRCVKPDGQAKSGEYCHHNNHCESGQCGCPDGHELLGLCRNWRGYDKASAGHGTCNAKKM